jgi:hypothetical protein
MLKSALSLVLVALCGTAASFGELLVDEPFDYAIVNDPVFGRLTGRNGGLGFSGPWQDDQLGNAFVYDQQGDPEKLYGGHWGEENPSWDGEVEKFPTLGGYVGLSDWWREHAVSPVDDGSHWNSNGESYFLIGDSTGGGLLKMLTP